MACNQSFDPGEDENDVENEDEQKKESLEGRAALEFLSKIDTNREEHTGILQKLENCTSVVFSCMYLKDTQIPAGLAYCQNLVHFNISGNCLTTIPEVTFLLLSLKILDVQENNLKFILSGVKMLTKLEEINLSRNEITDLTPVSECTQLRVLYVNSNKLKDIPTDVGKLRELKDVDISNNQIDNITPLCQCRELKTLAAHDNNLKIIPSNMKQLLNLNELNLSNNVIDDIKPLTHCIKLRALYLRGNVLKNIPIEMKMLRELEVVDLSGNELSDMAPLCQCLKLRALYMTGNTLTYIPTEIMSLEELEFVSLTDNKISDMRALCASVNLQVLHMSGNELMEIPKEMKNLKGLKRVYISKNKISDLRALCECRHLQEIHVSQNELKDIPIEIGNLKELKRVYFSNNKISDLGALCECRNLQELRVGGNKLTSIPNDIRQLRDLSIVDLSRNEITDLKAICKCVNIYSLGCTNCKISELPDEVSQLKKLEELDLSGNSLYQLPLYIDLCESLNYIGLDGNPLTRPPVEICKSGTRPIFQYFRDLRHSECAIAKQQIVILGETGAGKTSLALTMKERKSYLTDVDEQTHVLEKYIWNVNDELKVHITDFGGHHIYELAHTFFLCSGIIAFLVFDLFKYSKGKYDHMIGRWLKSLMFMSPRATVIIVGTHSDYCADEEIKTATADVTSRICQQQVRMVECIKTQLRNIELALKSSKEDDRADFRNYSRYLMEIEDKKGRELQSIESNLIQSDHVFVVSSKSLQGIAELESELISCCKRKAVTLPASWLTIQDRMDREDVRRKSFIKHDEFCEIVRQGLTNNGFPIEESHETAEALLEYQHQCGIFLWFKEDIRLRQYVFHRCDVVVEFLKTIFHHDMDRLLDHSNSDFATCFSKAAFKLEKVNFLQHGQISTKLLHCLLKRIVTDEDMFRTMIHLLKKFFLCFTVSEEDCVEALLFPWFLSNDEPTALEERLLSRLSNEHQYQLNFCFPMQCPEGFFELAMVLLRQLFEDFLLDFMIWKDGIYLEKDDDKALFTRKCEGTDIVVALALWGNDVSSLWSKLEHAYTGIRSLMKKWPGAPCDIMYLCPHCLTSDQETPSFFLADKLLQAREKLGKYLPCENSANGKVAVDVVLPRDQNHAKSHLRKEHPFDIHHESRLNRGTAYGMSAECSFSVTREFQRKRAYDVFTESTVPPAKRFAPLPRDSGPARHLGKDTLSGHFMKSLTHAFSSVAKLTWSNGQNGTAFRVGTRYLMTNYHVVKEADAPSPAEETRRRSQRSCLFNFDRPYQGGDEAGYTSFNIAPNPIVIYDVDLDYAVLELMVDPESPLPGALTKFKKLDRHNKVHFAGHPLGHAKIADIQCAVVHMTPAELTQAYNEARNWSLHHLGVDAFHCLQDQRRALYHTSEKFVGGSSGSPGFVSDAHDNPCVAVVHTFLLPDVPEALIGRLHVPERYLVEQGIRIEAIYRHLHDTNEALCDDIFPEGEPSGVDGPNGPPGNTTLNRSATTTPDDPFPNSTSLTEEIHRHMHHTNQTSCDDVLPEGEHTGFESPSGLPRNTTPETPAMTTSPDGPIPSNIPQEHKDRRWQ